MRLEELFVDGFGHFRQRDFALTDRPVTVFYGPNEAGKSTLMAFIRTVLFGFPKQGRNSHYPPLSGGHHGGRVRLSGDGGEVYTLERYVGANGGQVAIRTDGGEPLDVDTVLPRITGQATPTLFNNVFAFSIDELQEMGALNEASVSGAIYSAGQGVPGLPALSKALTEGGGRIFTTGRGRTQEVPMLVNALKDIDGKLRSVEGNAGRYRDFTARRVQIDAGLADYEEERSQLAGRQVEVNNLKAAWEDWVGLTGCDDKLTELPRYEQFPEEAIPRLEIFEERARQARTDAEEAAEQLRLATEAVVANVPDEGLLEVAGRVEDIRRDRGSFDGSVHDLPERLTELREMESNVANNLVDLGHQWNEAELDAFDTSLLVRNQVDLWKRRMTENSDRVRQVQARSEQERRTLLDRQTETQEAREKVPPEPPPLDASELMVRQDALRAAKGCLSEYERQRQNHETLRSQLNVLAAGGERGDNISRRPHPILLILLGLSGAGLFIAGLLLGGEAFVLGMVSGLVLIIVAAALWFMRGKALSDAPSPVASALGQQAADAERSVETARQGLLRSSGLLDLDGQPNAASLDSAEAHLETAHNLLDTWNSANGGLEDAARRERMQEQRLEDAVEEQAVAEASAQETQGEWQQWLRERQLDEALTADTMTTFLARVETVRTTLAETRRMRDRVSAIEKDIEEFQVRVQQLAIDHEMPLSPDDWGQLASAADALITRMDQARDDLSRRRVAQEKEEEARLSLERQDQRVKSVQQELEVLLVAGGTDAAEDFRLRARQHQDRMELEWHRGELVRRLELLSGPGEKLDAFRKSLAETTPDRLNQESERILQRLQQVEADRALILEERGGIDNELERLTGEEESSQLRIQHETLMEQLRDCAWEWSRLTVAEVLLEKTRQKFERERQPSVVRHAQEFFSHITGQRYTQLYSPIGERTITVMDAAGGSKRPNELSRGTREQLYLALRFGLVREFGEHAERLPVIVDEALVNFDPERSRLTAEAFAVLSETNQVLVFTCHPGTAELFADSAGAHVIEIEPAVSNPG